MLKDLTDTTIANRYLVKELIGEGGFCEVFLADDLNFDPPKAVAIKLLRAEFLNDPAAREDIRREASALAKFDHPNILPVLEFDTTAEQAYVVMKLIEGGSLAQKIEADNNKLQPSLIEVADYLSQICEAIDKVHEEDLIHCDLKPDNILLDKDILGEATVPVIADFGQVVSHTAQTSFIEKSEVIGTVKYMAPEQWAGHVGKASDIYAIGIITYELITGQPPFQGNSKEELKNQHATGRRPKLKDRAPHLTYPPALDQVFEQVLDRDPQRRSDTFPTATHFYHRFEEALIKSPTVAQKPATKLFQPVIQTLTTPSSVNPTSNPIAAAWPVTPSTGSQHPFQATPGSVQVVPPSTNSTHNHTTQVRSNKTRNILLSHWIGIGLILLLIVAAATFPFISNNVSTDIANVPSPVTLLKQIPDNNASVASLAISPDGKILASGSADSIVKLWDIDSSKVLLTKTTNPKHANRVESLSFSPDGKTLASGSGDDSINLWDINSGKLVTALSHQGDWVHVIAFSPDGKTLAAGCQDKTIKLWDPTTNHILTTFVGHTDRVISVSFSPDGKTLASSSWDGTIRLWEVTSGKVIAILSDHGGVVYSVTFSPDGKTLASTSADKTVKLWEVASGKLLMTLSGHALWTTTAMFSPDGKTLASGSGDHTIKLWDVPSGKLLTTIAAHTSPLISVAFNPDGKTLASSSDDNTIKLWQLNTLSSATSDAKPTIATSPVLPDSVTRHSGVFYSIAYSPNGKTIASGSEDKSVELWDIASGQLSNTLSGHTGTVYSVAYSPDGKTIASGSEDNTIKLWDTTSGKLLATLSGHTGAVYSVAFSPDGKTLASGSGDGTIKLWNVPSGKLFNTINERAGAIYTIAFTPDGKTLAAGAVDGTIKLWDVVLGNLLTTLSGHTAKVEAISFSGDGKTLASASEDNSIRLWNMTTNKSLGTISYPDTEKVTTVALSPDGKTIAFGLWDIDSSIMLYKTGSDNMVGNFRAGNAKNISIAFSPDGKTLASTAPAEGTIKLWDITSGQVITTLSE